MKLNIVRSLITGLLFATTLFAAGQTQSATLTDAQAQELTKKLTAASPASKPLTASEIQKLLAYTASHAQSTAAANTTPAEVKKEKVIRIGMVMPKADLGVGYQGAAVAEPLRGMISQYLGGPNVQMVNLDAMLPQQIDAEAQQKQCDYVVYSSLSQKKAGGGGMGFFKGATTMASMVPMVGAAKAAGGAMAATSMAANAATSAQQAASVSKAVKAKNEISLDYKLQAPGNPTALLSDIVKAKANTDGEDVVTPLVEKAATAIIAQVQRSTCIE